MHKILLMFAIILPGCAVDSLEQLRSEVCKISLKRANSGKIQILSKVEMAKKPYLIPFGHLNKCKHSVVTINKLHKKPGMLRAILTIIRTTFLFIRI